SGSHGRQRSMREPAADSSAAVRAAKREMLARLLAEEGLASGSATIPRRPPAADAPLSHAQEVLWLLDRATPGLIAYNSALAFRLKGAVDIPALQRALDALVARHETLRTRFVAHGEGAVQHVEPPRPAPPIQFGDFAAWERTELAGERLHEKLTYWRSMLLPPAPDLLVPTDRPRSAVASFEGGRALRVLPRELLDHLKAMAAREGVT